MGDPPFSGWHLRVRVGLPPQAPPGVHEPFRHRADGDDHGIFDGMRLIVLVAREAPVANMNREGRAGRVGPVGVGRGVEQFSQHESQVTQGPSPFGIALDGEQRDLVFNAFSSSISSRRILIAPCCW